MGVTKSPMSRPEVDQSEPEIRSLDTAPEELMDGENLALVTTNDEVAEQVDATLSFEGVEGSGDGQTEPADGADLNISEDPDAMTDAASDTAVLSEVIDADSSSPPGLETEAAPAADQETAVTESAEAVAAEEPAANGFEVPYFGEDESGARKLSVTGNEQLRFEFAADCWIEIRGADDALLYADLGRAGQVRRFVGVGPFKLKIGFAEGVKLFFDAQEVDLAPHTRNQMARLELGQ
jgi:cytoskeletal protein RodZ